MRGMPPKVMLGLAIVVIAIVVVFGFEWFELRYTEHSFKGDCAARFPAHICELAVERHGPTCEASATRSVGKGLGRVGGGAGRGQATVSTRAYRECLFTAAGELSPR